MLMIRDVDFALLVGVVHNVVHYQLYFTYGLLEIFISLRLKILLLLRFFTIIKKDVCARNDSF